MSNSLALQTQIQPRYGWDEIQQMAEVTARSGLFKMNAQQIVVLMMLAESEGIHPIRAVAMYDIIEGKPELKSIAKAAKFQQAGGVIEWLETSTEAAEAIFSHPTSCPAGVRVRYTIEDAKVACLAHKDNWKKNPADMLVARCLSRGVRRCLPGVLMGIYEVEEEAAPPALEQVAHKDLKNRLNARREQPLVDVVDAHGEVIEPATPQRAERLEDSGQMLARQTPEPPEKPASTPGTEWGKLIARELDLWNIDREKMAGQHPELGGLSKKVTPMQVVNHLVKARVGTDDSSLRTAGKRDPSKVVAFMGELWDTEPDWIEEEMSAYLSDIIVKATSKAAEQPALPMGANR